MTRRRSCPREADVLDLVAIGQWPARADRTLLDHAAACPVCCDLAHVASALSDLSEASFRDAHVPDAATIWYRAEARRRQEHARQAARPVTLALVLTAVCLPVIAWGGWILTRSTLIVWWRNLPSWSWSGALPALSPVWQAASAWGWVGAAVLCWLAAVPLLFMLARVADRGPEVQDH